MIIFSFSIPSIYNMLFTLLKVLSISVWLSMKNTFELFRCYVTNQSLWMSTGHFVIDRFHLFGFSTYPHYRRLVAFTSTARSTLTATLTVILLPSHPIICIRRLYWHLKHFDFLFYSEKMLNIQKWQLTTRHQCDLNGKNYISIQINVISQWL